MGGKIFNYAYGTAIKYAMEFSNSNYKHVTNVQAFLYILALKIVRAFFFN